MIHIEDLLIGQQNKLLREYNGGFKYGHDFNILRAIIRHHENAPLVKSLAEGIKDKILAIKVQKWISQKSMEATNVQG